MAISADDFLGNWSNNIANVEAGPVLPGQGRKVWPRDGSAPGRGGFEVASHQLGAQQGQGVVNQQMPPMQVGTPLNWNIDLNEGGIEQGNINYNFPQNQSGGNWSVGAEVRPGYSQELPGMWPGAPGMNQDIPTEYRGGVRYRGNNWTGGVTYGTRGTGVHTNFHY